MKPRIANITNPAKILVAQLMIGTSIASLKVKKIIWSLSSSKIIISNAIVNFINRKTKLTLIIRIGYLHCKPIAKIIQFNIRLSIFFLYPSKRKIKRLPHLYTLLLNLL